MTEWHSFTYDDSFSGSSDDEPRRPWRYRLWLAVVGAVLLLLLAGAGLVYWQRLQRRAAIREDLTAFIFEEETVRFLGDPDRASTFMAAAPPAWQKAYRESFGAGQMAAAPDEIEIQALDFDGRCGLVTVALDGRPQLRSYCLNGGRWQRAPVPEAAWGGPPQTINLAEGIRLSFRSRDEAFVRSMSDDLPALIDRLEDWATSSTAGRPDIRIEPHELRPPLVSADRPGIVLNSPWVAAVEGLGPASPETEVRLALAGAWLERAGLLPAEPPSSLPGAGRFLAAARTVLAAELLLSPEERAALTDSRRAALAGPWLSPFFADLLRPVEPAAARQAELTAYFTAAYIADLAGPEALLALTRQLPRTDSWDDLFEATLDRATIVLEDEAAGYARPDSRQIQAGADPDAPALPLQATLMDVERQSGDRHLVRLALPDQAEPVLLELAPGMEFRTAGGPYLPPACAPTGARLEVNGRWLEMGRRIEASQITVQEMSPLAIEPAPADTVAYLVQGEAAERDPAVQRIFPSSRSYLILSELPIPQALAALRPDGAVQSLTPLSQTLQVRPLPAPSDQPPQFLFILNRPNCDFEWFVHYDTARGVIGQWFGPPQPTRWVWRPDSQDLLFFKYNMINDAYDIYDTRDMMSLRPFGSSTMPMIFSGWNIHAEQLVFVRTWMGTTGVGLLEPTESSIRRLKIYVHPLRARQLSPDGGWLAYLTGANNLIDPPYRLDVLNLENLEESTLIQSEAGKRLGSPIWSSSLDDPRLAILAGPLVEGDRLRPTQLLVAAPDRPGGYETAARAAAGEQLATPVFCANGDLLYRLDRGEQYLLIRSGPDQAPDTLLTRDEPFLPVAC